MSAYDLYIAIDLSVESVEHSIGSGFVSIVAIVSHSQH